MSTSVLLVRSKDGKPERIIAALRDVTEQRAIEEGLRQAQKVEALGQVAAGVAHDFNNLLMIMMSGAAYLVDELPEGKSRKVAADLLDASERGAALTKQLLAFSRRASFNPVALDLADLVLRLEPLLVRMAGRGVVLQVSNDGLDGRVWADPTQVEQLIMNLVLNARDAMPHGGTITLRTHLSVVQDFEASSDSFAVLEVGDTGVGIPSDLRARIFEPFFTTKELGKGTGLGLATVFGIVKQSGGEIQVSSEPGRGCTFRVLLPRESDPGARPVPTPDAGPHARPGSETILLVEDEDALRNAARRVLEQAGYQVLLASNGRVGLEVLAQHSGRIHLLLSDVVMPEMAGDELARQARALEPRMKVLFMSGYSHEAIARYGVLEPGTKLLSKPFTGSDLQRMVREVLDAE